MRPDCSAAGETIDAGRSFSGNALVEIANAIVHVYKQAYGRGPTKARARFMGSDVLVVLLEDNLTVAERNLVALGEFARVREQRLLMEAAFEDQKRAQVERILHAGSLPRSPASIPVAISPSRSSPWSRAPSPSSARCRTDRGFIDYMRRGTAGRPRPRSGRRTPLAAGSSRWNANVWIEVPVRPVVADGFTHEPRVPGLRPS